CLGDEVADAQGRVHLGVGAVADDLVGGPLLGGGSPLPRLAGHACEGVAQLDGAVFVAPDQRVPLLRGVAHRRAECIPGRPPKNEGNPSLPPRGARVRMRMTRREAGPKKSKNFWTGRL